MDRWTSAEGGGGHTHSQHQLPPSPPETRSTYNTIDDSMMKEYEDPDFLCDHRTINRRSEVVSSVCVACPSPPLAPPPHMALRGTLRPTHLAIHSQREPTSSWRTIGVAVIMGAMLIIMVVAMVVFLFMGNRANSYFHTKAHANAGPFNYPPRETEEVSPLSFHRPIAEISPNHLLTLQMTKRKVCLFEASTDSLQQSTDMFNEEHIESAHLLVHSNLSRSGVPVHPLQFQRYVRSLGVDADCHVVLYDRGQMIWATYSAWIFKLFGHGRVSLLSGGFSGWKTAQSRSPQYKTEKGAAPIISRQGVEGDFPASWNESVIITFDDVFVNTEMSTYDLIDAQTKEEFEGVSPGALYGHIRGAVNIPIDTVYDYTAGRWQTASDLSEVFRRAGLSPHRPVIVYCSSSVRSSLVWWSLTRIGFSPRIYFGGWPEWVVRAPDYLKVLAHTTQ